MGRRDRIPPANPADRNHVIEPDHVLIPGGDVSKARANIAAIKLLKVLEEENRNPTPEEKQQLAQYTGWGGLSQVFDDSKGEAMLSGRDWYRDENWEKKWGRFYRELKPLLTEEEWDRAARSTRNAHFTSREVFRVMWQMAERLGFKGGVMMEPAGGIGHAIGLMPEGLRAKTDTVAVELDSLTGRMLKKLYPETQVFVQGFQDAPIPPNSVDLAFTNVPFAKEGPADPKYPKLNLHNYFIARMLDSVRPGGLVITISSAHTMDSAKEQRTFLASKGELVGAIRLPNTAFKANAGTDVVTDILILRKPVPGEPARGEPWTMLAEAKDKNGRPIVGEPKRNKEGKKIGPGVPLAVNEYFVAHPEMVMGTWSLEGTMHAGREEMTVLPEKATPLEAQLEKALATLPENVMGKSQGPAVNFSEIGEASQEREGTIVLRNGTALVVYQKKFADPATIDKRLGQAANRQRMKDYLPLRDHYLAHLALMRSEAATDEEVEASRKKLVKLYDAYVKRNGNVQGRGSQVLDFEPNYYLVAALETEDQEVKGDKLVKVYRRADVLSKRTMWPVQAPASAASLPEAMTISTSYKGRLDVPYMAQLLGMSEEAVERGLEASDQAFLDPDTGGWQTAQEYLSGNVRRKLEVAKAAIATDQRFQRNKTALEQVQPEMRPFEAIATPLGGTWLPADIVQAFARQVLDLPSLEVAYSDTADGWVLDAGGDSPANEQTYGTGRYTGDELLSKALNLKQPTVFDSIRGGGKVFNQRETTLAKVATEKLQSAFRAWLTEHPEAAQRVERAYNDAHNFAVERKWDVDRLDLPGADPSLKLRPNVKRGIYRLVQQGFGLLAHAVGAGKTFIMIGAAMEMKRLGLAKKPMLVVLNSTLPQFAAAFKRMYPGANLLVMTKEDLAKGRRQLFLSKVASGDFDAIIVAQSSFNLLPVNPEIMARFIQEQRRELVAALETQQREAAKSRGDRSRDMTVKMLQAALDQLDRRLDEARRQQKDTNVTYFDELGVDLLFVDEAHKYKKPFFLTKQDKIKGIENSSSKTATDMLIKTKLIQERRGGTGVVFATGTPVTNTLGEAWHMLRLVAPHVVKEYGVDTFDRFTSTFAQVVRVLDMNAAGRRVMVDKMAKFKNGAELVKLIRTVWDVITPDELAGILEAEGTPLPQMEGGRPEQVVVEKTPNVRAFVEYIRTIYDQWGALSGKEKREHSAVPVMCYLALKAAAIDIRMVMPNAADEPGSKINVAAQRIYEIWQRTKEKRGTQAVFLDLSNRFDLSYLTAFANGKSVPPPVFEEEGAAGLAEDQFLYRDLKRKLIELGIPEKEVAIANDFSLDTEEGLELFEKVNEGLVRVIIGHTSKIGTGVNIQKRLAAMHHLDTPWLPADLEQRRGRGIRAGNLFEVVAELVYAMKDTVDAGLFSKVEQKSKFIYQVLAGKAGQEFEDPSNITIDIAKHLQAALSDNPLELERIEVEDKLKALIEEAGAHREQQARWARDLRQARQDAPDYNGRADAVEKELPAADAAAKAVPTEPKKHQAEVDRINAAIRTRKEVILGWLETEGAKPDGRGNYSLPANLARLTVPIVGGATAELTFGALSQAENAEGGGLTVTKKVFSQYPTIQVPGLNGFTIVSALGANILGAVAERPEALRDQIKNYRNAAKQAQAQAANLETLVGKPFPRQTELAELQARAAAIEAELVQGKAKVAKQGQQILLEVPRNKPMEARREHIRRLLGERQQRAGAAELWWMEPEVMQAPSDQLGLSLEVNLLKELERVELALVAEARSRAYMALNPPKGITIKLGEGGEAGFISMQVINDLVTVGQDAVRRLGGWGVSFARWSTVMVRQFGPNVRRYLASVWQRLARLAHQAANNASATTQGHINAVEQLAGRTNIPAEEHPLYDEETLERGRAGLLRSLPPASVQLRQMGGEALAMAKLRRDVEEATQAEAVKRQADELWRQLRASAAQGNRLSRWHLPEWLIGTPRARQFRDRALHIAARLNATGRDAAGNFTFAAFRQRMGTMSVGEFHRNGLNVGDVIQMRSPATGQIEDVIVGPLVTTPEGRAFHQLYRDIDEQTQHELYRYYQSEYPDLIWFLDMFIDPALANTRQTINGVEVPIFNRFAAAAMMADGDPAFSPLTAYTPDVLVSRSLIGSMARMLTARGRSPGRRYKTGTSRESGHVRDLLSGFNVRTWQMLAERARRDWARAVMDAAVPIRQGVVPEGFVKLETGMDTLWEAVRRLRRWHGPVDPATGNPVFPETEARMTDDGSAEYRAFFGEAASLRGRQLMIPQRLVSLLAKKFAAQRVHGILYRTASWFIRNSVRLFLVMPVTYVQNVLTNDLFALEAMTRRILSGVMGANAQDLRFAREMAVAETMRWFPGLRRLVDRRFRDTVAEVLPDRIFEEQTRLADLKMRLDESPWAYLRQGEIGAAALNLIRYGQIDIRAKQRMAYAWLKAQAVTNARRAGLRGAALRRSVDNYLRNPPMADRAQAVELAAFELLNYADSPQWLEDFSANEWSRLVLPFPRFGYHYIAKNARRAAALRDVLARVPRQRRADAFADFITFLMWPAGGLGILAAAALKGFDDDDDEEDARQLVGTSFVKSLNDDGNVISKPIDRNLITVNRMNLSAWARLMGLGGDNEDDFWLRVRSYPVISMAGAAILAENDARKFGAKEGVKSYVSMASDLAADFFSVGMALKVPAKAYAEFTGRPGDRVPLDPYAAGVPFTAYVTDQTLDSFVPGSRQFDVVIRWVDPVQRRRRASKELDFEPGIWDAARVGHVTGLLDRLIAGESGQYGVAESTLPAEGDIWAGTVAEPRRYGDLQRYAELGGFNLRPVNRADYEEAIQSR